MLSINLKGVGFFIVYTCIDYYFKHYRGQCKFFYFFNLFFKFYFVYDLILIENQLILISNKKIRLKKKDQNKKDVEHG